MELGAVQEAGMRCHFWVNGRNSPPLAYSSAYTSCSGSAVQENSPPWPTSNPTLRDIRPTMALPSCIGREKKDRVYGRRAVSGLPDIAAHTGQVGQSQNMNAGR